MAAKPKKNPNNEGTIYERKDGRWEGSAYVLTTDGTYKRRSVYGKTWDEAHEKLTFVYTRREAYVMSMVISEFCSRLPEQQFFRCH